MLIGSRSSTAWRSGCDATGGPRGGHGADHPDSGRLPAVVFDSGASVGARKGAVGELPRDHSRLLRSSHDPPVRGRLFTKREPARLVAVIDEAFAKQHFAGEDPIGRSIHIGNARTASTKSSASSAASGTRGSTPRRRPTMYAPFGTDVFGTMWVMVKTADEPLQLHRPRGRCCASSTPRFRPRRWTGSTTS